VLSRGIHKILVGYARDTYFAVIDNLVLLVLKVVTSCALLDAAPRDGLILDLQRYDLAVEQLFEVSWYGGYEFFTKSAAVSHSPVRVCTPKRLFQSGALQVHAFATVVDGILERKPALFFPDVLYLIVTLLNLLFHVAVGIVCIFEGSESLDDSS
jgi:hypothetical protein